MTGLEAGLLMALLLALMLIIRVQIGVAMFVAGALGYTMVAGVTPVISHLKDAVFARFSLYDLSVVPLFILMGQFATHGGLSKALFHAGNVFLGHRRGGVAMAGVAACAGFGAICGSSLATAATMTNVVLPELRRYHYGSSLATGSLAAAGTLGILIPPSVPLVIYAILAEQNIAKLFMAAAVPGVLAALGYMLVIAVVARVKPQEAGEVRARATWSERLIAVFETWPVLLIFLVVLGGIYGGVFTPTEAAAIGTVATGLVAWKSGGLRKDGFVDCVLGTAKVSGMMFLILLGADMLNSFLALSQIPAQTADLVQSSGLSPLAVLFCIIAIYLVLGCVMDSLSMILLTIPIFLPIIMGFDYFGLEPDEKAIWFGIIALVVMEIGLITPPVGMNAYIISSMVKDVPLATIFRGVLPFVVSDLFRIVLLVFFPVISLGLLWAFPQ